MSSLNSDSGSGSYPPGSPAMASSYEDRNSPQEGIVDEEVPDHVFEQCNEALAEEVKKLQV